MMFTTQATKFRTVEWLADQAAADVDEFYNGHCVFLPVGTSVSTEAGKFTYLPDHHVRRIDAGYQDYRGNVHFFVEVHTDDPRARVLVGVGRDDDGYVMTVAPVHIIAIQFPPIGD